MCGTWITKADEGRDERRPMARARRKQFFFEKKNQKTLTCFGARGSFLSRQPTSKSFLFLFFKKEMLPCFACFRLADR
jgi:hypothetical protein